MNPVMVGSAIGRSLIDRWWLFLVRGLLAIAFGVVTLLRPGAALMALVLLFGIWAFIDGLYSVGMAFSGGRRAWQLFVIGLVGIGAGVVTFYRPELTALGLYALVAAWSIARGIMEIALAIELRHEIHGEGWLIFAGISSIIFGALLIALPAAGVIALLWLISFYALFFGGLMLVLAFRLRGLRSHRPTVVGTPQPV